MAKTLFHSSERSNFIVNLKPERLRQLSCRVCMLAMILLTGSMLLTELTQDVYGSLSEAISDGGTRGVLAYLVLILRSVSSMFAVGGVLALIFAFIALIKKQFDPKRAALPAALLCSILILGYISALLSFDTTVALIGMEGRGRGVLALLFYGAFFVLCSQLHRKEAEKLGLWITGYGLAQCLFALFQILPIRLPSSYDHMFPRLLVDVYLPSGLSSNPAAFAMLLTMLGMLAVCMALYSREKKCRLYYTIAAAVFLFFLPRTQCLAGLVGLGAVLVTGLVLGLRKGACKPVKPLAAMVLCAGIGFGTACAAPLLNGSKFLSSDADTPLSAGYHLQDGSIVFLDGAYRNDVCGQYSRQDAQGKFDLEQPLSIYPYMWKQAAQTIAKYPLLGTGADNYIYAQLRSSYTIIQNLNIVDDPYNDYLYQAATRGIPALLLYLALAAVSLLRGAKAYRKGKAPLELAVLLGAGGYLLTAVCGISALPVTPVFWMLLGLSCGGVQED